MAVKTKVRKRILQKTSGRCFYCKKPLAKKRRKRTKMATIDHFIPKALGGRDSAKNLVPACFECNQRKGMMKPEEFMAILQGEK